MVAYRSVVMSQASLPFEMCEGDRLGEREVFVEIFMVSLGIQLLNTTIKRNAYLQLDDHNLGQGPDT